MRHFTVWILVVGMLNLTLPVSVWAKDKRGNPNIIGSYTPYRASSKTKGPSWGADDWIKWNVTLGYAVRGSQVRESREASLEHPDPSHSLAGILDPEVADWKRLQNLSLQDLDWRMTGYKILPSGVAAIRGNWNAGEFTTFNSSWELKTVGLEEEARIFLPPNVASRSHVPGIVWAVHHFNSKDYPWMERAAQKVAEKLGVAVLLHGEKVDWRELGWEGRDDVTRLTFLAAQHLNPKGELVDAVTGNYGLALAKVNVMAMTLLEKVFDRLGSRLGNAAYRGGSKEGYAAWVATAVDSRATIGMPGGFWIEDFTSGLTAFEPYLGLGYDNVKFLANTSLKDLIRTRDWLRDTKAGQRFYDVFAVSSFVDLLPRNMLIVGDAGLFGMHDGRNYIPPAETPFLESLISTGLNWRYDRKPNDRESKPLLQLRHLATLALALNHNSTIDFIPKVASARIQPLGNGGYQITADIKPYQESGLTAQVWWTSARKDVPFNHPSVPPLNKVNMTREGNRWVAYIQLPTGKDIHPLAEENIYWYVEAEETMQVGRYSVPLRDASPIQIISE